MGRWWEGAEARAERRAIGKKTTRIESECVGLSGTLGSCATRRSDAVTLVSAESGDVKETEGGREEERERQKNNKKRQR